ncbi:MAG TPA: hypothetical protein PLC50_09105, partial [Alicycliphilus sp.]|nr:hypothetical protein [Alicycliphilus sp.]
TMYIPQASVPNPFGLSLSKPGRPWPTALRQAQGERVYLRKISNQAKQASSAHIASADSYQNKSSPKAAFVLDGL